MIVALSALALAAAMWSWRAAPVRRGPFARSRARPGLALPPSLRPSAPSRSREVASLAGELAAELRSGRSPDDAWESVTLAWRGRLPGAPPPRGDVVAVLHRWGAEPGWSGLRAVAACWRVADAAGVGLADALDRVATSVRQEHEVATEVHSQLASVRATAAVLVALPAVALVMGHALGADSVGVLFTTAVGRVCLIAGVAFAALGWWWLERQVTAVRRLLRW